VRRYLLDTNHASPLANDVANLIDRFNRVGGELFLCQPVVAELWEGVFGSARQQENEAKLGRLLGALPVLGFDADAAREYGRLRHHLKRVGQNPPQVDVQVMAIAIVHGLTILTADAHFAAIPGVAVDNWLA